MSLQDRTMQVAEKIACTKLTRVLVALVLAGYVALGLQTYLAFPGPLMQDLDTYLNAYAQALKGLNPYAYSNILTAYLYPLPGLLIAAPFFYLPEGFWRSAVFSAVNLVLLAWMVRGIARHYEIKLKIYWWWFPLAFGFAPLFELLHMGQINVITSFGIFLMFAYSDVLPTLAGLGLAVAVVTKLVPVVFFVFLAIQRRFREIAWGLGIVAGAYAITYFLFGSQSPTIYLDVMKNLARRWAGSDSSSLVSILYAQGWIESGAWIDFQRVLLAWIAIIFVASGICAFASKQREPLFIIVSIGSIFVTNVMWYHYYVFLLLPLFIWMAWSKFHPVIVA
ncbi:MAG: DUF2029 domain-containing protein, partial [Chloroflexi bacterium]|nr:DUF2029 domain-containing protein [Chloroflexota bacterium]